jgi:SAM-dependent methyltransferase
MARDPYDELPYTDHAYAESHPDRLAVVALLSGWEAPALRGARVLELGCGRGGNLLPMAASLPEAAFVGVDRGAIQIEEARHIARATGTANVTFHAASFEEVDLPRGAFDFVVCHGVYSWVPPASRRVLLDVVAASLSPRGVAYVSFNVLPGWYARMAARDWLGFAKEAAGPAGSVAWLAAQVSPELGAYRSELEAVAARLKETDRAYAVHEYLAADNHPETLAAFAAQARSAGLAFLGDAIPSQTAVGLLPDAAAKRARAMDAVAAQQLADFVRATAFRRALLVRADTAAARVWTAPMDLDPAAIEGLRLSSRLRAKPAGGSTVGGPEWFTSEAGSVQVGDPAARRALSALARVAPRSMSFDEVAAEALAAEGLGLGSAPLTMDAMRGALAGELFEVWLAAGGLELHAYEPALRTDVAILPRASPVARWRAANGGPITNVWHEEVRLAEPVVRFLLGRLDGTRDLAALVTDARAAVAGAPLTEEELRSLVQGALALLASSALLV